MILGVSGLAGVGKDTAADYLVKYRQFVKVALADPMKRICLDVFTHMTVDSLWGPSDRRSQPIRQYPRPRSDTPHEHVGFLTPRYALQRLGSEWGRDCYENVWVDYALHVAKELLTPFDWGPPWGSAARGDYTARMGLISRPAKLDEKEGRIVGQRFFTGVVIPDVRFRNEMDAIRGVQGKLIRLIRGAAPSLGEASLHQSETEQQEVPNEYFDHVVYNDGSLGTLFEKLDVLFPPECAA